MRSGTARPGHRLRQPGAPGGRCPQTPRASRARHPQRRARRVRLVHGTPIRTQAQQKGRGRSSKKETVRASESQQQEGRAADLAAVTSHPIERERKLATVDQAREAFSRKSAIRRPRETYRSGRRREGRLVRSTARHRHTAGAHTPRARGDTRTRTEGHDAREADVAAAAIRWVKRTHRMASTQRGRERSPHSDDTVRLFTAQ
eukprot:7392005-Prymnesium_polylepis.1